MRFFGERRDAPAWDTIEEIPVPVGQPCVGCAQPIAADDSGLEIPFASSDPSVAVCFWHTDCFLRSVLGSLYDDLSPVSP